MKEQTSLSQKEKKLKRMNQLLRLLKLKEKISQERQRRKDIIQSQSYQSHS